jgi:hypothetical protein
VSQFLNGLRANNNNGRPHATSTATRSPTLSQESTPTWTSPSWCVLVHFIFCFFRFFRILTCFRMSECGTLLRMWAINFSFLPRRRVFLPGWRWARIMQLALAGSSSSLHSEVCKALKRASACFTTNFLSREFAFARLPPKRRDFAREDFNRNEVVANILCLGLGGMFGISVLVGVFAVCLVATESRC